MRIYIKFLIVLSATLLLSLVTIIITYTINYHEQVALKESLSNELGQNIQTLIGLNSESLKECANDYSYWDDMVDFVGSPDEKWADENLSTLLQSYNINAVWVFDASRKNMYHISNSSDTVHAATISGNLLFDSLYTKRSIHTYYLVNNATLIEVAGATIHPTNDPGHETQPKGYFFIARVWNTNNMQTMERITSTKITVLKIIPTKNTTADENTIYTVIPINNWLNNRVCYLQSEKKLEYLSVLRKGSRSTFTILIITTFLLLAIFALTTTAWVLKPLHIVVTILKNKDLQKVKQLNSFSPEFRRVGLLIQNIFNKNELLKTEKEKAEKANRFLNTFLYNINHEMRTPMNSIIGFSRLLIQLFPENDETKYDYANHIEGACYKLLEIVDDIIDISHIQSGKIPVTKTYFTVNEFINGLLPGYNQKASRESKKLIYIKSNLLADAPEYYLNTDKTHFQKILDTLVGNALKFTHSGYIEIGINPPANNELVFYVSDTGIGISVDKLDIIFENFQQASESESRYYGGNGIGLAICKGLVKALGGKIWVQSELNIGSVFYFSLPYTQ